MEKVNLNQNTLEFIFEFEKQVGHGSVFNKIQIEEEFKRSKYNNVKFDDYDENGLGKSMWWALKRSGSWEKLKNGVYKKKVKISPKRNRYIRYLSENLYDVLLLKKEIKDKILKTRYLSSKGIGEDLFYLTESYFRQNNSYKNKYYMSDFITLKAKEILETKDKNETLVYEHMVPKNIYLSKISEATLDGSISIESIYELLNKYYFVCTVTKSEDKKLPRIKMDDVWNRENPFDRYERAEIGFINNY